MAEDNFSNHHILVLSVKTPHNCGQVWTRLFIESAGHLFPKQTD